MLNQHRRRLVRTELDSVLAGAGLDPAAVSTCTELTEGTFNTAYRILLATGEDLVLKVAPPPEAPLLTYEHGIMATEEAFYRAAGATERVPTPRVVHADYRRAVIDSEFLLMTTRPGRSWSSQRDQIGGADHARMRAELGGMVAALHQVTGPGFGYPAEAVAPLVSSWRAAFVEMVHAVLDDAVRFGVTLPQAPSAISDLVTASGDVLDEVTTPVLVHFDLWDGNILTDLAGPTPRVSGLIDGERAFWGDPVADFVSLALFDDLARDLPFLTGYRSAGGSVTFDAGTRLRVSLYRIYLYLIMLVECAPRGYSGPERDRTERLVGESLIAELDAIAEAGRSPAA